VSASVARPDIPVLTSLRFWAAAIVVLNHLDAAHLGYLPEIVKGWCRSGYEAVTFFFVLSGFILTYVYSSGREHESLNVSVRRFQVARLARIGPAYYLALALLLPPFVYGFAVAGIMSAETFALATIAVPTLVQAWWPPVSFSWNGPAWSLSVEVFFYALFPALYSRTRTLSRRELLAIAAVAVLASALARLYMPPMVSGDPPNWRYFFHYFPLFHLPSFVFGMALGRIFLFGRAPSEALNTRSFVGAAIAVCVLLGYRSALPPWLTTDAVLVPLYGIVILTGARLEGSLKVALAHPRLVLLGHASYSIYILHIAIVFWWQWVTHKVLKLSVSPEIEIAILLSIVMAVSVCVFLYFERPLRRWIVQSSNRFGRVRPLRA
jgi:peptidoglycan/LPS O-acetylase OafA/YrhL